MTGLLQDEMTKPQTFEELLTPGWTFRHTAVTRAEAGVVSHVESQKPSLCPRGGGR